METDKKFCDFRHFGPFLPFYMPNNPENQNFKKMKKVPGDIIILHMYIKNHNNMYVSWDTEYDRLTFFVNLGHFLPFYPLTIQKIRILIQWKNSLKISSLHTSVSKIMIICYTFPEIWQMTNVIFILHLFYFLPFYSYNGLKVYLVYLRMNFSWKSKASNLRQPKLSDSYKENVATIFQSMNVVFLTWVKLWKLKVHVTPVFFNILVT